MSNSEFLCKKSKKSGVECPQGKKCAPLHVTNMRSIRISASGGDDDRRRAFPPPRRWWQPCVTPYFATRGRGDMRGVPNRSCTQSHPGGGAGLCFRRGAVCIILCTTWLCGAMTACHHLRGGILGCRLWSPHVADTPVGEIRGYAQRQPPTGVGNYLAFGHHLPTAESRRWHPIRDGHLLWSVVVAATQLTCP